jgi:SOS-response transcriptional repressor LexA
LHEIGCIHTVQGYDLNYTGVIFGKEINYNPATNKIEIDSSNYFDKYGRIGVNEEELKNFIVNIYKTIMYRGIKGTFIYAYNKELREYLQNHIETFKKEIPFRILRFEEAKPYVNSIPLVDISAAAGNFSDLQQHSELTWVEPPFNISAKKGYFICKVIGESMNKKIPNGSYCLFRQDEGGSRNGKIVLVESTNIRDSEFGSGYTVKEYHSKWNLSNDERKHESIILKPLSTMDEYEDIILKGDDLNDFRIRGIFMDVIE